MIQENILVSPRPSACLKPGAPKAPRLSPAEPGDTAVPQTQVAHPASRDQSARTTPFHVFRDHASRREHLFREKQTMRTDLIDCGRQPATNRHLSGHRPDTDRITTRSGSDNSRSKTAANSRAVNYIQQVQSVNDAKNPTATGPWILFGS